MRRLFATIAVAMPLAAHPAPAVAQSPALERPRFESWAPPPIAEQARQDPMGWLLGDGSRDHRYTGFYAGAATGAVLGVVLLGMCSMDDSGDGGCSPWAYVLGPISGAALLGAVGALIGGAFEK